MTKKELKNLKPGDVVQDELFMVDEVVTDVDKNGFTTDMKGVYHCGDSLERFKVIKKIKKGE